MKVETKNENSFDFYIIEWGEKNKIIVNIISLNKKDSHSFHFSDLNIISFLKSQE